MRTHCHFFFLFGMFLLSAVLHAQVELGEAENPASDLWSDPSFRKSFTGSYGFLAEKEPDISNDEADVLRELLDLIPADTDAAIERLEQVIDPDSSAAFDFILGNLYFEADAAGKAEASYKRAIDKHPEFRRAHKNLGLLHVREGNYKDAVRALSQAMELGEVNGRAYGLLGYSYLALGDYYPAAAAYRQAILMQPDTEDWKAGLARALVESDQPREAISLLDSLLKEYPDNGNYWLLQTNAFIAADRPLMAAENLEIIRRMGGADVRALTLLGDIYMNNTSPGLALNAYLEAADQADDSDAQALLRATDLLIRSGNHERAGELLARIKQRLGDPPERADEMKQLTLEARIARAAGDDERARSLLKEIVERDALNGEALIELGKLYAEQGEMTRAVNRFEQAEKIEGFERKALIAHARALVKDGALEDALPLLRRALKLESDEALQQYMERVERAAEDRN